MKHRGMKILSLLLSLVMVLGLMPGMTVLADDEVSTAESLSSALSADGTAIVKLGADITTATSLSVNGTKTLDLNGHKIRSTAGINVITVNRGATLTINGSGIIELDNTAANHAAIRNNGILNYNDAKIISKKNGIDTDGGKTNIYSGTIELSGNGTALNVFNSAALNASGGIFQPDEWLCAYAEGGSSNINISGGIFKKGKINTFMNTGSNATIALSGGYFPNEINSLDAFIADGYLLVDSDDLNKGAKMVVRVYTITYKVANGTWADDSTGPKTETVVSGSKPASVPTGMKASQGFTGGSWDKDPANTTINEATTFTYTFTTTPTYTVTYVANNGTEDKFGPNTMTIPYRVEGGNMFAAPDGMKFVDWLVKGTTDHYTEGTIINSVSGDLELVAQWESVNNGGNQGGQNNQGAGDVVFYGGFGGGDESWSGGYVTGLRAYRVSLAPMQGGSATLVLNTGESGTEMNVYPQTTVRVVPSPAPGYKLASIVWSLIDGSASYDITQHYPVPESRHARHGRGRACDVCPRGVMAPFRKGSCHGRSPARP